MTFLEFENPSGPLSIIFAEATMFALIIPFTDRFSIFGIYFSNKIYMYLLCCQVSY